MEGLVALIGITLVTINLCGMAYLFKSFMHFVIKFIEWKEWADSAEDKQ